MSWVKAPPPNAPLIVELADSPRPDADALLLEQLTRLADAATAIAAVLTDWHEDWVAVREADGMDGEA